MKNNNNISNKFFLIIKQFLLIIFYMILILFLSELFKNDLSNLNQFCYILMDLIIVTIFIILFRKIIIPDFYDFKKNIKNYLTKYYIYWFIGLAIMVYSNLIISHFIGMPSNEEGNLLLIDKMPIYMIFATTIMAPINEELMTRVILKDISKKPYVYIILSGLIFGSLHLLNMTNILEIFYVISYSALGSVFAYMYYKSNNIWINISFHAIHNSLALLLIFI